MVSVPWKIVGVLGLALALIAGAGALYLKGRSAGLAQERNATAADTLKKVETDRKDREKNDETTRNLDDDAALRCLRQPEGCARYRLRRGQAARRHRRRDHRVRPAHARESTAP